MNINFLLLIPLIFHCSNCISNISKQFKESSHRLIDYLVKHNGKNIGYNWLEVLVDDFGNRHLGSKALDDAIDFTLETLSNDGFNNVHGENVDNLPHWVRGDDEIVMLEPRRLKLNSLAIGGTRAANITAPVVVLNDLDELEEWQGYSRTSKYRRSGADVARRGGVGVLVKSIAPFSLSTPHTGSGASDIDIPAACLTLEESELLERLYKRGKTIVLKMDIKSDLIGSVTSRNTVFEIEGSTWPEEIVLLSGHMDSWDVGQGALDDGGGMAAVYQAMKGILNLSKFDETFLPKRTIRGVFWTAEEQGLLGAQSYYNAHKNVTEKFYFVSETDEGAFRPKTFNSYLKFHGSQKQKKRLIEIVNILNSYGIPLDVIEANFQGDVNFWSTDGVPAVNYISEQGADYYFYFHHTQADYLNIFKEGDIDYTAAIFSVLAHVIANMESW